MFYIYDTKTVRYGKMMYFNIYEKDGVSKS